ncbi:MAG TPA: DDE-type integrase/transposase/recombinase [Ktedonobacterales bacterium]|jgi:transposase
MPNQRGGTRVKRKRTPSPEWQAFQATLLHPDQVAYEVIRPVVTLGQDLTSRAAEVGLAPRTLARKVEQFVQFSIPGLVASSTRKPDDKRLLPPSIRDYILQLKAEHALLTPREIATIVEVRFDRSIGHHTIERVAARGPLPKLSRHRFPFYRQLRTTPARREAILRLHLEGWSATAIISYLHAPRTTVYDFLQRWAQDAVVKPLGDRKRGRPPGARKATLSAVAAIKQLQEESAIGAFRMAAALKQQYGIVLSPRTCGRIMAKNRELYGLWAPPPAPAKPKKPMPFATSISHRWWSVDLCYIERHHLPNIDGPVYIWTILDNASRQIVASAPSKTQTLWDFLLVLFTAIHVYGAPIGLVSDGGSVFTANAAVELYQRLGIEKAQIERRRKATPKWIQRPLLASLRSPRPPRRSMRVCLLDWHVLLRDSCPAS